MLLIPCPHCGGRDENEFSYGGDATVRRPGPEGTHNDWMSYIFLRANPKGRHKELWFHGLGCRRWLEIDRDTMTHEIFDAIDAGHSRIGGRPMSQEFRSSEGGRIDRSKPLDFTFDGKRLTGFTGDTLASALLANGVHLVGRSFKYHRPRGIVAAGSDEPNALVQLEVGARTEPNIRATRIRLEEGLRATSQNAWPALGFDIGALNNVFSRLIPAGFYYKTFMGPASMWMTYEHFIRKAAGMGKAPREADPDRYEKRHAHCDVLVIGAGPAGLAAALAAGRTGARVILADEQAEAGGSLLADPGEIDGAPGTQWLAAVLAELKYLPDVTSLSNATAEGFYEHNLIGINEQLGQSADPRNGVPRQRYWHVRAKQVVLATGSIERPLVFADNDRPGIMLADAARTYLNRYGVKAGTRAVLFTNNDGAYAALLDLARAGVAIAAAVDLRVQPQGPLTRQASIAGIRIIEAGAVVGATGGHRVRSVDVMKLNEAADGLTGSPERIACDLVLMSGGWNPAVHLFSQSRGKLRYEAERGIFLPGVSNAPERSAGAANGTFGLGAAIAEGLGAGTAAAHAAGFGAGTAPPSPRVEDEPASPMRLVWQVPTQGHRKRFVDFQNDVTASDVALAVRENYRSVEHLKRYTTLGMGTDQGKTSSINGLGILAELTGAVPGTVGTTTFRPPYTPITFGAFAGRELHANAHPVRRSPMQDWHEHEGVSFLPNALWLRPQCYRKGGESLNDAINREALAVRNNVGLVDVSTLGKIDIQGPDAVEFLNRVYINGWSNLAIGKGRYGLMLREDGFVFDDGVTTRLAERHFHMTTTTGNAARVYQWLEHLLQTQWPDLKVHMVPVSDDWAAAAIVGPKSREVLAKLADIDVSDGALPFMGYREGRVAGIPARVFRISFSGERSFEVNVPADHGLALWEAIIAAGKEFDLTPYGLEALSVLRIEKGHIVGSEFDGRATPGDLGFDKMTSRTKDFIGRWALTRPALTAANRLHLVGLLPENTAEALPMGAQIIPSGDGTTPQQSQGHVTSSVYSANLGRHIGLGLVANGRARHGETVVAAAPLAGRAVKVVIGSPHFIDPENARLHG